MVAFVFLVFLVCAAIAAIDDLIQESDVQARAVAARRKAASHRAIRSGFVLVVQSGHGSSSQKHNRRSHGNANTLERTASVSLSVQIGPLDSGRCERNVISINGVTIILSFVCRVCYVWHNPCRHSANDNGRRGTEVCTSTLVCL